MPKTRPPAHVKGTAIPKEYPCPLCRGREPNGVTARALMEAERGRGMSKPFSSVEELLADLSA